LRGKTLQSGNHFTRTECIHITERAAKERRETNTKTAPMSPSCAFDDLLTKAARRFVKHHHHTAFSTLNRRQFSLPGCRNKPINRRVDLFLAFTPFRA
jgi:hypothetical protein